MLLRVALPFWSGWLIPAAAVPLIAGRLRCGGIHPQEFMRMPRSYGVAPRRIPRGTHAAHGYRRWPLRFRRSIAATTLSRHSTVIPSCSPRKATCGPSTSTAVPHGGSPPAAAPSTTQAFPPMAERLPSAPITKVPMTSTRCPSRVGCPSAVPGTVIRGRRAGHRTVACWSPRDATRRCRDPSWCSWTTRARARPFPWPRPPRACMPAKATLSFSPVGSGREAGPSAIRAARRRTSGASTAGE